MKITQISTALVRGHGWSCFVRIDTDEGLWGMGECIHGGGGIAELIREMAPMLIGKNPLNVEPLYEGLRRRYLFDGALGGAVVTALSGIDMALLDLTGKALGVGVAQLLGGRYRDRVRLYADCHAGEEGTPESAAQKAQRVVQMGFTALKFDLDDLRDPHLYDFWTSTAGPRELNRMVETVAAIREAIGYDVDLCVDLHGRYDLPTAIQLVRLLEPYRLMWIEEPVPPENVAALREVTRQSPTPICVGENLYLRWGFREVIETHAADIIMPDLPKCGGLSEGKKIADYAAVHYIAFAPHNVCGPLGTVGSAHCCAAVPNFLVLEWHWLERPHWDELVLADPPLIRDGYLHLPDGPGLGVTLNLEAARRYAKPNEPFFDEPPLRT